MAKFKGIDFVLKVNTGTPELPAYTILGGQRGATINRSADSIDATTKDGDGWKEFLAGLKEWGIDTDGLVVSDATAYDALETAYNNGESILIEITTPNSTTYKGSVIITDFPIELPYDDSVTYSVTLQGTGALTSETTV